MTTDDVTGVLLMAYGTPNTPDDIEPYYTHIRGGRPPTPELLEELKARYALVGGRTPLSDISEATRDGLQKRLNESSDQNFRVILGMKHWHPYIKEAVRMLASAGISRAIGLVLAPHYSRMSVEAYYGYIEAAQQDLGTKITLDRIDDWHLHRPYLEAVAKRTRDAMDQFEHSAELTVVFTAHSLPQKILAYDDPYPDQLLETSEALAKMLDIKRWTFSYQSAGRTPDPWLGPDICHTVNELADAGVKNILVVPVGFVSDHLEIFYDLDYEAKAVADSRGVVLKRIEMLNASSDFVTGLSDLVLSRANARKLSGMTLA
ncbi:MAG: ferrochelatase [Chloroflexota bacterium]